MSLLGSLRCWWTGRHAWRVLRSSCHRAYSPPELEPTYGTIAKCSRCGIVSHDECMRCELQPRSPDLIAEVGA
jgi:hypothetical protein